MKAKHAILEKLRLGKPPFSDSQLVEPRLAVSSFEDRTTDLKMAFIQAAEGLACQVYDLQTIEDFSEILNSILEGEKIISAWNWDRIPCGEEIETTLNALSVQVAQPHDPFVNVGITGVDAAFAATGSVVLNRCLSQPTGPSLLPPIHIAIITEDQILPNFEVWVAQQRTDDLNGFQRSGNIVIVSGPSRTADIAMQLILGMHGPKELHIIILPKYNKCKKSA